MEAYPTDLPAIQWTSSASFFSSPGPALSSIGDGRGNTLLITTQYSSVPASQCAAKACIEKENWYLPSKDELYELYINKSKVGNLSDWYWSSTAYSPSAPYDEAYALNVNTAMGGDPFWHYPKSNYTKVRPVRYF